MVKCLIASLFLFVVTFLICFLMDVTLHEVIQMYLQILISKILTLVSELIVIFRLASEDDDVYSFGFILLETLLGSTAFRKEESELLSEMVCQVAFCLMQRLLYKVSDHQDYSFYPLFISFHCLLLL